MMKYYLLYSAYNYSISILVYFNTDKNLNVWLITDSLFGL